MRITQLNVHPSDCEEVEPRVVAETYGDTETAWVRILLSDSESHDFDLTVFCTGRQNAVIFAQKLAASAHEAARRLLARGEEGKP